MCKLVNYLSCGRWYERDSKPYGEFIVSKFSDIELKIIPFFEKYPMYGDKRLDFESFNHPIAAAAAAAQIISTKGHLTGEGLDAIYTIKKGMNKERYPKDQ